MNTTIRNRIVRHQKVKAKDLVPHELNPRTHSDTQRAALTALYNEIGFARSVLAYELPDGRLKLIDGHLRQSMDPEQEVEVEVLDVTDEEARKLLLSIDPLAQLASFDKEALDRLQEITHSDSEALTTLWSSLHESSCAVQHALDSTKTKAPPKPITAPERFIISVECDDEKHQVALLRKLKKEGLKCRANTL